MINVCTLSIYVHTIQLSLNTPVRSNVAKTIVRESKNSRIET